MSESLLDILADKIYDSIFDALGGSDWVGKRGEKLTEKELKWLKLFSKNGMTLKNIYLPKDNGETSEIDLVYITVKGIFVIESKNYSGWIFGDEKSYNWTAMLPNKEKNKFYNPVFQNRTHIKWLLDYLNEDIPVFSLIVFSERCELKKVPAGTDSLRVIKRDRLVGNIRDLWDKARENVSEEKVKEIYDKLLPLTNADEAAKQAHIEDINRKYKADNQSVCREADTTEADTTEEKSNPHGDAEEKICPKCGGRLVLRTAKNGPNAGKQFYGCSSFPKCRFIENI